MLVAGRYRKTLYLPLQYLLRKSAPHRCSATTPMMFVLCFNGQHVGPIAYRLQGSLSPAFSRGEVDWVLLDHMHNLLFSFQLESGETLIFIYGIPDFS